MPGNNAPNAPVADLAIFGLGPGGLAAALQAASTGKKVVAFTDRDQYIRGQRLKLSSGTIEFLKKFEDKNDVADIKFFNRMNNEGDIAQTKDIERYMYRKLEKMQNVTLVKVDKKIPPSFTSDQGVHQVNVNGNQTYQFRDLLAADGARHGIADQAAKDFKLDISYQKSILQPRHRYHASVQLKSKTPVVRRPKLGGGYEVGEVAESMLEASKFNWDQNFSPNGYVFANETNTKFTFSGEIPKSIYDAPDDEKPALLRAWATRAIQAKFDVSADELEYRKSKKNPEKNKLQHTTFQMESQQVNESVHDLPGGGEACSDWRRPSSAKLSICARSQ